MERTGKQFLWDPQKNEHLKRTRGISFEEIVPHLQGEDLLDDIEHPNAKRYPGQRLYVVRIQDYVYVVPCVESNDSIFLKTAFPSRKATREYLTHASKKEH